MIKKWTVELKNSIEGNGIPPTIDPFDNSVFYVADGWGSTYSSMRIRKLSCENGKELTSSLIKNMTRCIYINENQIFAVSEKRILELNRKDLSIEHVYKENIPQYSSYVNSNDKDTLLLMCSGGDFFYTFNLKTNKKTKKKLKGCCGITKIDSDNFLIFSCYDGVFKYNLAKNTLAKTIKTVEPFPNCVIDKSNNLYIHCGKLIEKTYDTNEYFQPLSRIVLYKSLSEENREEIDTNVTFEKMQLSENEGNLYLYKDNSLYLYSLEERKIINNHTFSEKTKVLSIFDSEKLVFTYEYPKSNVLTCWEMK